MKGRKNTKRIVYFKMVNKGSYPTRWNPLCYDGKRFYKGGCELVVVNNSKEAMKVKKLAEKQFGEKLYHFGKLLREYS